MEMSITTISLLCSVSIFCSQRCPISRSRCVALVAPQAPALAPSASQRSCSSPTSQIVLGLGFCLRGFPSDAPGRVCVRLLCHQHGNILLRHRARWRCILRTIP
ncbi:hypothetical protein N658DRAFT_185656 [Parathielavia hyrcaniae]|uniref:Uncharacterized protein n=1 Tax=Parathielavia hyrcaniae TaxID=113614 RepID=A0AAN6Q6U7_9PEZI|nr:hypothetical protein N658DRAFT_185656 [Parathielavia hyrcaniae]